MLLAHSHPEVARATALLALGRVDEAIGSYESALAREAESPNLKTEAYIDLAYLIATNGIRAKYEDAMHLLEKHKARLMFPVDHFRWHAVGPDRGWRPRYRSCEGTRPSRS